jgi:hypothetical protein
VLANALALTNRAAAPVSQTAGGISRDAPSGEANRGPTTARLKAAQPLRAKPQHLFLTRAHGAVFNVKKLKSVVIKKERAEHPEPFGPPGGDDGDAGAVETRTPASDDNPSAEIPSKLARKQMVQSSASAASLPSADSSFDGLDYTNWGAGHPPDENGDIGPTYYIETVNTSIGIFDKSTGNRVAAFTFNAFMSQGQFGNLCDTANFGDPVVLYDSYENRWLISDFAFTEDNSGNISPQTVYQCFAVSKTGDPVNGGWNYYSILDPGGLGDYPKFGIWPDGIYMSANMFGYSATGSYTGYHVWALNKQQMYAGAPQVSVVDFAGNTGDFTVIPVNSKLAAGAPPAGSPEYFVSTEAYLNALAIYKFHVNWDKVSTSTFTGPFSELAPNCWPNETPASAATTANPADVLAIRAMAAPQYTNQGGVESLWVAHTVERGVSANNTCSPAATTGGNATIRWYQANVTGGTIATSLSQGSSFDPDNANTNYRYQPALAVDRVGDMAVTYTESNSTTNPKVMYDGRLAGDPTNTLEAEQTLIAGTGSQSGKCGTSTCVRWGDYAGMELDPNGCEFWMVGEYFATTGLDDLTRIGSFHYPGCTPVGNGTLSGTVTNGTNPISGATITLGSRTTTTAANGTYSFTVPAGTYLSLTADSPGYTEGTASSLAVPNGGTLTQNFTLSGAAQSGCVTDNSQALFQRGVPTNCDLTSTPGVIQLAASDNTATQNSTVSPAGFNFTNTSWAGQTFTPTVSGKLKEVDVELFCLSCTTNSPNVTLSIRATTGATPVPTGSDLATSTLPGFNDDGAGGLKTFILNTPLQVTAGTHYAFIFRLAGSFSTGGVYYTCSCSTPGYSNSNPYAGGQFVTSSNSGSTWAADTTSGGRDLNFVAHISPGFGSSGTFVSSIRDANPAVGSTPHWTTLSFIDTTPANTGVKFQVAGSNSQYGPWNYLGPDGTANTFFTTSGASLSEFNGDRYLRYEAFLSTTNSSVTPSISSVQTCFQDVAPAVATTLAPASASGAYGGTTTLSATLTSGGNGVPGESVSFTVNSSSVGSATTNASGVATLQNVSLSGISAGSYPTGVAASFAGDSSYLASSGSSSLTVSKASQTILISTHAPTDANYGDQFTVAATGGGSGNAVTYGSSGSCSNAGATFTIISSSGQCTVSYNQAGNTNYNAAPQVTDTVNGHKANQTIQITTHAPATGVYGTGFSVAATGGGSGNPVTYGSSGACTNTGANYTMTSGTGTCTVTYDEAGNTNYNAAPQKTESVTAQKANQTINVSSAAPSTAAYNSSFDVAATAPGGAIAFGPAGPCSNAGAHFTMTSGTGTCTVLFDQSGNANYNAAPEVSESVTATKINQSITFATPAARTYGDPDFDPGATSSSGYSVSYGASGNCSIVSALVHITGAGSCTVMANQAGDADYNAAPQVQRTFSVGKASQAILIGTAAPASAVYGAGFAVAATGGGSGNTVTYGSSGACTNTSANFTMTSGTGTCTVTYDQAGNANYNAATQQTEAVTAAKAGQTITFATPAAHTYGNSDFDPGATASSGNAVSYGASGNCAIVAGIVHFTGAGACSVTASQAGDANYSPAPPVQRTFAVARAALSITANNQQKYFDQSLTLGATAFTRSGLVGTDSISGVTLTSTGAAASAASGSYSIAASNAVAGPSTSLGNYTITYHSGTLHVLPVGIIGLTGVSVTATGGKIDSFNSAAGAYSASNHGSAALVMSNGALSFAGVGLLGSTISTLGTVAVASTASVSGSVTAGTTVSKLGTVAGAVTQHSPTTALSTPTVAACPKYSAKTGITGGAFTYSATTGNLAVKSGTVKLANKTYCFNNITLAAGSTLSVSGPVTIHLRAKLAGKGKIANTTNLPANLHIDTSYTGSGGVAIVGNTHTAMTLLAPKTTATVAGGAFFGTLFAKTVTFTGAVAFHADMR